MFTLVPGSIMASQNRKKRQSVDLNAFYDFENEYEKWRAGRPEILYDVSIEKAGLFYWTWTLLIFCGCLYNMLIFTIIFFDDMKPTYFSNLIPVNMFFDIVYFIEVLLHARIAYYDQGVLITNVADTRKTYINSWKSLVDVLSFAPIDYIFLSQDSAIYLRLNRLLKSYRMVDFIDLSYNKLSQVTISLSKIIIICFLLFHWNACLFYVISINSDISKWKDVNASFDDDEFLPWPYAPEKITNAHFIGCEVEEDCYDEEFYIDEDREDHLIELYNYWNSENRTSLVEFSRVTKEYAVSIYWSSMTMTTLGEQPPPNTTLQNIFEVLNTVAGLILFAAIMGSIGDLVSNANEVEAYWQSLMDGLKQYMTYRNLNVILQTRVLKYCAYEKSEGTILKEHQIRELLPTKLYSQINNQMLGRALLKSPIFRASERSFMREVMEQLEPHYYSPGDVIAQKGHRFTELFVVVIGSVVVVTEEGDVKHREGSVLGDINLFWFQNHISGNTHMNPIVSTAFSQVHILYRDDFLRILYSYPVLAHKFTSIAKRILVERCEIPRGSDVVVDQETTEDSLRRLCGQVLELEDKLDLMERKFLNFSASVKKKLFKAERAASKLVQQTGCEE